MSNFKCENKECENFDKIEFYSKVKYIFKNNELIPEIFCVKCNKRLLEIKEERKGDINIYVATFNSKSDQEKRDILKKRADDHTNKKMKDSVQHIKRRFGVGER